MGKLNTLAGARRLYLGICILVSLNGLFHLLVLYRATSSSKCNFVSDIICKRHNDRRTADAQSRTPGNDAELSDWNITHGIRRESNISDHTHLYHGPANSTTDSDQVLDIATVQHMQEDKAEQSRCKYVEIYREGVVKSVNVVHEDITSVLAADSEIRSNRAGLFELLRPVLESFHGGDKLFVQRYDTLVAVLWNFYKKDKSNDSAKDEIMITENYTTSVINIENHSFGYRINCSNIHQLRIYGIAGYGNYRTVYKGDYLGKPIIIKVVNQNTSTEVVSPSFSNLEILREIFIYEAMPHKMLAEPYGYCIHEGINISGWRFTPGIISVFAFGVQMGKFQATSWETRLKFAVDVADFLNYASISPLGSVIIGDFRRKQLYMVDDRIVMSDYHMIRRLEEDPPCNSRMYYFHSGISFFGDCIYNITCVNKRCKNFTYKYNLTGAYYIFFEHLLQPAKYPLELRETLVDIRKQLNNFTIDFTTLLGSLTKLLQN